MPGLLLAVPRAAVQGGFAVPAPSPSSCRPRCDGDMQDTATTAPCTLLGSAQHLWRPLPAPSPVPWGCHEPGGAAGHRDTWHWPFLQQSKVTQRGHARPQAVYWHLPRLSPGAAAPPGWCWLTLRHCGGREPQNGHGQGAPGINTPNALRPLLKAPLKSRKVPEMPRGGSNRLIRVLTRAPEVQNQGGLSTTSTPPGLSGVSVLGSPGGLCWPRHEGGEQ